MFDCDPSIINNSTELSKGPEKSSVGSYMSQKFNDSFNRFNTTVLEPMFVGDGRKESSDHDIQTSPKHTPSKEKRSKPKQNKQEKQDKQDKSVPPLTTETQNIQLGGYGPIEE
jgi:hypothetical protein